MRIACLGGGPAGLYFAIAMKRRAPRDEIVVVERNRPVRHLRVGRGAVGRDPRQSHGERSRERRRHPARLRLLGRHRRFLPRQRHALVGPRLLRHRPQASAQHSPGSRARSRRDPAVRHRVRERRSPTATTIWWSRPTAPTRRFAPRWLTSSSRTSMCAPASTSGSARASGSTTRSPSSSRRPSTAGSGRMPTSSMPIPRRSSSNARMPRGAGWASTR